MSWLRSASTVAIAALTLCAAVLLGLAARGEASDFRAQLNLDRPLVPSSAAVAPPPPRLARRVIVLLIDGLRLDSSRTMPVLNRLRARGVDAEAVSHYPTLSRPNYVSMFAGVPPRLSGVRTNDHANPVALDTVFSRAREASMRTHYVTGFVAGAGRLFGPALDDVASVSAWPGLFERVVVRALADQDPFLVIHISEVNLAGHAHGADSDEYRAAVAGADGILGRVLAAIDHEHDAVVVVSDHGHIDEGGHGGREAEVVAVPLVLAGPGVRSGAKVREPRLVDVAPTLCALLGLPAPRQAIGRTLVEALRLDREAADALARTDEERARELERAAEVVATRLHARAWLRRLVRIIPVTTVLVLLIAAVRLLGRRGVIRLDRRVLVFALPAFPVLFYSLLAVFEPFLSPSMIPEENDLMDLLLRYGAIAAAVNVVVTWLAVGWRSEPRERLAAATGTVLTGLLVALFPAGLAWIAIGPPFAATIPGPTMMMLPPVTFAGVACYAASAAVALVAECAVFASRTTS